MMETWLQILISCLSSSVLASFIPFISLFIENKFKEKRIAAETEAENNKEKAKYLYNIIEPALSNCVIMNIIIEYIKNKQNKKSLNLNMFYNLYEEIDKDGYNYQEYIKWLKSAQFKFNKPGDISFDRFILDLMNKDILESHNLSDFVYRYFKLSIYNEINEIKIDKLNKDIEFINSNLGIDIPLFKED